ncbi:MAG: hypothetical protein WC815_21635 [Vicinamibacterales bacterium]|jgi:hypothetical protein
MRRAIFVLLVLVALPAAALGQPTDPATARTEPAMRQVPARAAGFGASGRNVGEMRRIDQSDLNRMIDQQRGNRAGEMREITPRDLEIMRQDQRNREIDPFRRNDNVQQLEPGRDIPTPEQAREMQRRSAEVQRQAEENFRRAADLDRRTSEALRNSMERSRQMFQGALDRGLAAATTALEAWQILHPSDHTCLSNTSPAAMPIVPSMCAGSAECASCYSQAYGRLDRTRGNLEKLRCIYNWNKEYSERAKSFGDNVSSVHAISGLAWQQERRKIERAVDQLGGSYDAKYRELLGYVREDLASIGACEARFFDNPDWSVRYGFMFYGFLEDRYRR